MSPSAPLIWQAPQQRQQNLQLYASHTNAERAHEAQRSFPPQASAERAKGLSVCILNRDKPELIVPLVEHLVTVEAVPFIAAGLHFEVVIGDTGSADPHVMQLYTRSDICVRRGLRYQFSACNNTLACQDAQCDTLLFLNNDVILGNAHDALWCLYRELHSSPDVGIVGSCLFFPDGTVQHMGIDFLRHPRAAGLCFHPHAGERLDASIQGSVWSVPAVTGACLMIKHDAFVTAGGMDEAFTTECQDVALCLTAARLGWSTRIVHTGPVVHLENATRPRGEENWADRQRFLRQWGAYIEAVYL